MHFAQNRSGAPVRRRRALLSRTSLIAAAVLACGANSAQAQSSARIAPIPQGLASPSAAPLLREGVAAIVNNDIISTYDLRQRILLLIISSGVRPTPETLPSLEREALRDLVEESLQMQEIRRIETSRKVTVQPTDAEIDEDIATLARQNNLTGPQLVASLSSAGVDPETLRAQIRAEGSWRRYVGGAFAGSVSIGEEQIDAAMKRFSASAAKPQYLVAEIFLDAQRAGGVDAAVEGAKQLITQIQQGAPFTGVARQFSSAATAASGGDAGWLVAGDLPQAVEQVLDQMRPGQLSQPIPVSGGVYIILLRDKRSGADTTLVDLKQAAIRLPADAPPAAVDAAQAKLESLRASAAGCETFEAKAGAIDGVVAGALGETDIKDLSPTFQGAIANLQPGQVSQPVRSDAGMHVIALCARRAGGANMPTRDDVRDRLFEQELSMISRRELRDLRNSANIESK